MLKQLFLATILFAGFCMSAVPDQIMMGTDGKNTITLTYVKISPDIEDEALRIRYRVEKESPLAKNRASASICCTNQVLTPEEVAQAAADKAAADQAAAAAAAANAGGRNLADEPAAKVEFRRRQHRAVVPAGSRVAADLLNRAEQARDAHRCPPCLAGRP